MHFFSLNKTVLLRDRKRRSARAPTSKSFQNVCPIFLSKMLSIFCPKLCPFFVPKFVQHVCPNLWGVPPGASPTPRHVGVGGYPGGAPLVGGYPRGPSSWGVPPGAPYWGVPPGPPPVNRQTENITVPSYSVCGR